MWDSEDLKRAIEDYKDVPCNTHIYFKRKDGSVFGKLKTIPKSQVDTYIKDGCVKCDINGKELASPKKIKKSKKK